MVPFGIGILIEIVTKAGSIITSNGDRTIVRSRSDSDYTTVTDLNVETFIKDKLVKLSPKSLIIAEESFDPESISNWSDSAFVLDPVDGTINFRHSYNASAISLAYFDNGAPVYAVVYDPFRPEIFTAEAGSGTKLNGRPVAVSGVENLASSLIGFGTTPYDKDRGIEMLAVAGRVYSRCQDIRRQGAAALDLAYVACGRLDAFFEMDLKPWDFYGGALLVSEAGGRISDWHGAALEGFGKQSVLASNGLIHDMVMDELS